MSRTWKIVAFALAVLAVILVASLGRRIGRPAADYVYDKYKETAAEQAIEKQLEQAAQEANKQLSKKGATNDLIDMDSVAAGPGKQLRFLFTVHHFDQPTNEHLQGVFAETRDRLCASNLARLLDRGVTFNYRYRDNNGRWEREFMVRSTDCRS